MSDVFISYKSEDREAAALLASVLERRGLSVWWDRQIPAGQTYDEVIERALREARCVLVLWSRQSVFSEWVKTEASEGANRDILVPVLIEDVEPPLEFKRRQAADLSAWAGDERDPAFVRLIDAIHRVLSPEYRPADMSRLRRAVPEMSANRKWRTPILVGVGVLMLAGLVGVWRFASGEAPPPREEAKASLAEIVAAVAPVDDFASRKAPITPDELIPNVELPPIGQFPLVVTSSGANSAVAEIFVSTEKSGSGSEGWMVEVGEAFNSSGIQLANGRLAQVEIRKIASGTGYEFISSGEYLPQGFSPSNHLWIEMSSASGTRMTPVSERLVENVAGLVLTSDKADGLRDVYGELDISAVISAVNDGNLPMAYTDPFASSTGLNFLAQLLIELGNGDILAPGVEEALAEFQQNVPYVALTTLQIRDSVVAGGQLEAFVMEYQTFVNTDELDSGFEFIPFGIRHDNPLYAVGNVSDEEMEVLELFSEFATHPDQADLAEEFGFDPPSYDPQMATPTGAELIAAQQAWKVQKDGGETVTAVFVTDVSGSMQGSRIDAVRKALIEGMALVDSRNSIGLVTFNQGVTSVLPIREFDLDHARLFKGAVEDIFVRGGTAMYDGIAVALQLLVEEEEERQDVRPVIIVLTDGETREGHTYDDLAPVVEGLGIPIYTIGFEADLDELRRISSLVEAASINANEGDVVYRIGRLFNAQL